MELNVVLRQGKVEPGPRPIQSGEGRPRPSRMYVDGQGGERPRQRLAGAAVLGSLLLVGSDYVGDVGEGVFSLLEMSRLSYNRS